MRLASSPFQHAGCVPDPAEELCRPGPSEASRGGKVMVPHLVPHRCPSALEAKREQTARESWELGGAPRREEEDGGEGGGRGGGGGPLLSPKVNSQSFCLSLGPELPLFGTLTRPVALGPSPQVPGEPRLEDQPGATESGPPSPSKGVCALRSQSPRSQMNLKWLWFRARWRGEMKCFDRCGSQPPGRAPGTPSDAQAPMWSPSSLVTRG